MPVVKVENVHGNGMLTSGIAVCPVCGRHNAIIMMIYYATWLVKENPDATGYEDCRNPDCTARLTVMLRDLINPKLTGMEPMLPIKDNPDITGLEPGIGGDDE